VVGVMVEVDDGGITVEVGASRILVEVVFG
jgi:hypothetical protein